MRNGVVEGLSEGKMRRKGVERCLLPRYVGLQLRFLKVSKGRVEKSSQLIEDYLVLLLNRLQGRHVPGSRASLTSCERESFHGA